MKKSQNITKMIVENKNTIHFSNNLLEKEEKIFSSQVHVNELNQQVDFVKMSRVSSKKNLIPSF